MGKLSRKIIKIDGSLSFVLEPLSKRTDMNIVFEMP
jgi:hypothetical protein